MRLNRNRSTATDFRSRGFLVAWGPQVTASIGAALLIVGLAGCGRNQQITEHQRKEARHLVAEADFAMNLREWARAEGLLAKATSLAPDEGAYWTNLGSMRVRLGNKGGAKDAYLQALKAHAANASKDQTDPDPWLRQVYVLALLGRVNDGRALLEQIARQFPGNRQVRVFIETKQLDLILAEPGFKQAAL